MFGACERLITTNVLGGLLGSLVWFGSQLLLDLYWRAFANAVGALGDFISALAF